LWIKKRFKEADPVSQDPGFLEAEIPRPAADGLADNHVIKHVDL
jgi:hypothetical protein